MGKNMGISQNQGYLFGGPHSKDIIFKGLIGVPQCRETVT